MLVRSPRHWPLRPKAASHWLHGQPLPPDTPKVRNDWRKDLKVSDEMIHLSIWSNWVRIRNLRQYWIFTSIFGKSQMGLDGSDWHFHQPEMTEGFPGTSACFWQAMPSKSQHHLIMLPFDPLINWPYHPNFWLLCPNQSCAFFVTSWCFNGKWTKKRRIILQELFATSSSPLGTILSDSIRIEVVPFNINKQNLWLRYCSWKKSCTNW